MISTEDMLAYIEGRGGDVNSPMQDNFNKWTPLRYAAEHKDLTMVSALLEAGADVKYEDNWKCLHLATRSRITLMACALIEAGIQVNRVTTDPHDFIFKTAPIIKAVVNSDIRVVEKLLQHGASVNVFTAEGKNPLELACLHNSKEGVKLLISHYSHEEILQIAKSLCFQLAFPVQQTGLKILTSTYMDTDVSSSCKQALVNVSLARAIALNLEGLVKFFINFLFEPTAQNSEKLMMSETFKQIWEDCRRDRAYAQSLPAVRNTEGQLQRAVESEDIRLVCELLASGAQMRDSWKCLHIAINAGNNELVNLLVESGVDVNRIDRCSINLVGATFTTAPVIKAVVKQNAAVLSLLLKKNCELNVLNPQGLSAMELAVRSGWKEGIILLLPHVDKATVIHLADLMLLKGNVTGVFTLVDSFAKADIKEEERQEFFAWSMDRAILAGNKLLIMSCLNHGAKPTQNDTLLLKATALKSIDLMRALVDHGWDVNKMGKPYNRTPLVMASTHCWEEGVQFLLLHGATTEIQGASIPTNAVIKQHIDKYKMNPRGDAYDREAIYETFGTSMASAVDEASRTTLLVNCMEKAFKWRDMEVVRFCLQNGASPNLRSKSNVPFLHIAVQKNWPECLQALIDAGVDVNLSANRKGGTALYEAVFTNAKASIVQMLLDQGADPQLKGMYVGGQGTKEELPIERSLQLRNVAHMTHLLRANADYQPVVARLHEERHSQMILPLLPFMLLNGLPLEQARIFAEVCEDQLVLEARSSDQQQAVYNAQTLVSSPMSLVTCCVVAIRSQLRGHPGSLVHTIAKVNLPATLQQTVLLKNWDIQQARITQPPLGPFIWVPDNW